MSHIPTDLDIKTDLRRAVMASFSENRFKDINAKTFLKNAEKNLKKVNLNKSTFTEVVYRLKKAKDPKQSVEKRREDVLTASLLI